MCIAKDLTLLFSMMVIERQMQLTFNLEEIKQFADIIF